jgi:hypothetical protein
MGQAEDMTNRSFDGDPEAMIVQEGQAAANNQRVPSWPVAVAVLRALEGLERMDKLRTLGVVLSVLLADPEP